ncbi:hypothetical protein ARMSODRAFT_1023254 [Armillaria solidipes]|uniref:Ribonuclease H1 N-terminal domain-containing protein n=1 Tax=Armillaria solidipes TaxID=1076256 RepID=A0A2H3B0D1_9AGAR|nr:hypothetical protein ARMSODRAFT_1023254 [Armillaria solidipes]
MCPVPLARSSTPVSSSTMSDLSTESSLSMDSVSEALTLIVISSDDDDEQPPPGRYSRRKKGRSATAVTRGSQTSATRAADANTALPPSPFQHPTLSPQRPRQPRATMRLTGQPDGFYVVMNGRIMGVFDSWNLTEGSFSGFAHQSYRKFPSLSEAVAVWEDTWMNQEIGYPADRRSNQRRFGAEWGDFPGVYTDFERALHSAGVQRCEVVVTRDIDIADRLFDDFMQCGEVVVV